jgi:poly(A) polymerase Pap1
LCFVSSPAAVSIWNHPRNVIINAINDSIHNIRLTNVLIVEINDELHDHVVLSPITLTELASHSSFRSQKLFPFAF